jgi:hypothetical protein
MPRTIQLIELMSQCSSCASLRGVIFVCLGTGQISVRPKEYFADKSYGDDIESIFIGLSAAQSSSGSVLRL